MACGPEAGTGEDAATEQPALTQGADLVRCFGEIGSSGSKDVRCRLVTDGPLPIREARLSIETSSSGSGATLTPTEPDRVVYASNVWTRVDVSVIATVDASKVVGIAGDIQIEAKLAVDGERTRSDEPARAQLPFLLWDVTVIGKDASLAEASLADYELSLPRNQGGASTKTLSVKLPDVAMGEAKQLLVAAPKSPLAGKGRFGSETRAFELVGSGVYFARPSGFEYRGKSALPETFACWAEKSPTATELKCQRRDAGGLFPLMVDVHTKGKDGSDETRQVLFDTDGDTITVITDSVTDIDGIDSAFTVETLTDAGWPYTVELVVRVVGDMGTVLARDGAVIGFASDNAFEDAPLLASGTFAQAAELPAAAPLVATLPFKVWKVTFKADTGILFAPESIDPYEVPLGVAWNGIEAGKMVKIEGDAPMVSPNVPQQTFFVPVGPETSVVTGKAMMNGGAASSVTFSIAGPGTYVAKANGLAPATP
jgi:hypothetical protein